MKYSLIKEFIIAISMVGSIFMVSGCNPVNSLTVDTSDQKITLSQAIEISKKELENNGVTMQDKKIEADEKNSLWGEYSTQESVVPQSPLVDAMNLEKKDYWAIHFAPMKPQMRGGDVWVFIDKNSGEIIGIMFGK